MYRARSGWRVQVDGIAAVSLTLRRVCRLPARRPPPGIRDPRRDARCTVHRAPPRPISCEVSRYALRRRTPSSLLVRCTCVHLAQCMEALAHRASTTTDNSLEPDLPCALYRKSPDLSAPSRAAWAGLPPPLALLEFGGNYLLDDFQRGLGEKRRWVNSRAPFGVQQNFAAACVLASVPKKELGTVDLTVHVR